MRPCADPTLRIRSADFGGPQPLICVPIVAGERADLLRQAALAHALAPDVVEWRADSYHDLSVDSVRMGVSGLRGVLDREPIIFTLRVHEEGGAKPLELEARSEILRSVLRSGSIDILDVELCNGERFIEPIANLAGEQGVRLILSFHDFQATPSADILLGKIAEMVRQGADIAKIACMPQEPEDVLRLLHTTLTARRMFPAVPLCTMCMGPLGVVTRVAGFLFGSDMSFAVGQAASAPGQIPIGELRAMFDVLNRHA